MPNCNLYWNSRLDLLLVIPIVYSINLSHTLHIHLIHSSLGLSCICVMLCHYTNGVVNYRYHRGKFPCATHDFLYIIFILSPSLSLFGEMIAFRQVLIGQLARYIKTIYYNDISTSIHV